MRAASPTVRDSGPLTLSVSHASARGCVGTSPGVVRKPTTPQKAAGVRSEPPRSEPWASGPMPVATATAAPPLERRRAFRAGAAGWLVKPVDEAELLACVGRELALARLARDVAALRAELELERERDG